MLDVFLKEFFIFVASKELQRSLQPNTMSQTDSGMLALYTSRYMRAQASFFFHFRMCLRRLSTPLPCKSVLEPVCRSTCKADLSSHLGCSRLSQCCFLTCKLLSCPRFMQVYRYSSQKSTEQPKCKELQRTLHPIAACQMQSNFEVRRCRVSVLNY